MFSNKEIGKADRLVISINEDNFVKKVYESRIERRDVRKRPPAK